MSRIFLAVFVLIYGSLTLAWHELGHRTTATIAYSQLTPKAKQAIQFLLQAEDFTDVSVWPDTIKGKAGWKQTSAYHYSSVSDNKTYLETLSKLPVPQQNQGDLVMATMKAILTLRDPQTPVQAKYLSLKFLIHFIGDLHQPLHTGRPEDKGGNSVRLNWFGRSMNLHSLWDGEMLATAYADPLNKLDPKEQDKWFAGFLMKKYPQAHRMSCEIDVLGWFNNTMALRPAVYDGYNGNNTAYLQKNIGPLEQQVLIGGYKLACLLNILFENPTVLTVQEKQLIQSLNSSLNRSFLPIVQLIQRPSRSW